MLIYLLCPSEKYYTNQRLKEEFQALGHQVVGLNPYQAETNFDLPKPDIVLHRTTGVHRNNRDLDLSSEWQRHGALVVNSLDSVQVCRNKLFQDMWFNQHNLHHIPTWSFRKDGVAPVDWCEGEVIVKMECSNQGRGTQKFANVGQANDFFLKKRALGDEEYLLQSFVTNAVEYRVILFMDQVLAVIKKQLADNEFLANRSMGGEFYLLERNKVDHDLVHLAIEASQTLQITYCAIDLFLCDGVAMILEINAVPGLELWESLSKSNKIAYLAKGIVNKL